MGEGDSCELAITVSPGTAQQCGVKVRRSPGGEEETILFYDAKTQELAFDATHSGVTGRKVVERAPFVLRKNEDLHLRVFVDKSVVEVFANSRQAIARRVSPSRPDSIGVSLFSTGGKTEVHTLEAWKITPSNTY